MVTERDEETLDPRLPRNRRGEVGVAFIDVDTGAVVVAGVVVELVFAEDRLCFRLSTGSVSGVSVSESILRDFCNSLNVEAIFMSADSSLCCALVTEGRCFFSTGVDLAALANVDADVGALKVSGFERCTGDVGK